MTFEEMTEKRYSVKKFTSQPVEEEKLKKVLETAAKAPTAKNAQCIRIYVLKSEEAVKKARDLTPCTYGAPVVLLFAYEESEAYVYPRQNTQNSGEEDCSIVATHVMYEALEQGLSTCWVNNFNPGEAHQAYNLPDSEHVVLLMPIGYEDPAFHALPNHTNKKPLNEIVHVL